MVVSEFMEIGQEQIMNLVKDFSVQAYHWFEFHEDGKIVKWRLFWRCNRHVMAVAPDQE